MFANSRHGANMLRNLDVACFAKPLIVRHRLIGSAVVDQFEKIGSGSSLWFDAPFFRQPLFKHVIESITFKLQWVVGTAQGLLKSGGASFVVPVRG